MSWTLRHNQECIKKQLAKFLDFESDAPNRAELVNNYDWMKDMAGNNVRDADGRLQYEYGSEAAYSSSGYTTPQSARSLVISSITSEA